MSSANNAKLVASGTRMRGGPIDQLDPSHAAGIAPAGPLVGAEVTLPMHTWSRWVSLTEAPGVLPADALGLYRVRQVDNTKLLYVGEGRVGARLLQHHRRSKHREHPQGRALEGDLQCSWVANPAWLHHHRLELENDLIASHVLVTGACPADQFIG